VEKLGGSYPSVSDKRKQSRSLFHLTTGTDPSSEILFWEYHTGTKSPGHCVNFMCKAFLFINNFWVNHRIVPKTHIYAVSLEAICRSWFHIVRLSTPPVRHKVLCLRNAFISHTHTHTHTYAYVVGHIQTASGMYYKNGPYFCDKNRDKGEAFSANTYGRN
jgi:hypothetical protein